MQRGQNEDSSGTHLLLAYFLSYHELYRHVDEKFHAEDNTFGRQLFIALEEKSRCLVGLPIKSKSASHTQEAAEAMLVEFNPYGHKVERFTTDDARTLATLRIPLGKLGFRSQLHPLGSPRKAHRAAYPDAEGSSSCHGRWLILPTVGSPRV